MRGGRWVVSMSEYVPKYFLPNLGGILIYSEEAYKVGTSCELGSEGKVFGSNFGEG